MTEKKNKRNVDSRIALQEKARQAIIDFINFEDETSQIWPWAISAEELVLSEVTLQKIAEIELNVMTRQCLNRRIDEIELLRKELSARETERNTVAAKVNWHFRTSNARIKLSSLYPVFTVSK